MRGPVGSLKAPEQPQDHQRLEADGVVVYVHAEVLADAGKTGAVEFAFGMLGRTRLVLTGSG